MCRKFADAAWRGGNAPGPVAASQNVHMPLEPGPARPWISRRPTLTVRLFLAVLATATLVALAMGVSTHTGFTRGFLGYLNQQAERRMEAAVPRLQQAFIEHGRSWDFLRGRAGAWFRLIEPESGDLATSTRETESGEDAPHLLGAGRRLTLLDAQRLRVIGYPLVYAESPQREIVVDGQTVGWVALAPVQAAADAAAVQFGNSQARTVLLMGLVSVALAALIAWWVARALLAPVQRVAAATSRLAAGQLQTRVPIEGQGEVAQLGQDFNRLAQTLEDNECLRRAYMADVSHELRTPLAVLRGEIEAMQDGVHPLDQAGLQLLHTEVLSLGKLVHELHELALADAGALQYDRAPLDLLALLEDSVQSFRQRFAERGLQERLETELRSAPLAADAFRMRQLLRNLLENACRYTDPGGSVRIALKAEPRAYVLEVEDSAPGIPHELLPRLFERFFRADSSRNRGSGGSGLGLAICRSIVQAHGGQIEALASPMGGLCVRVWLPFADVGTGSGDRT